MTLGNAIREARERKEMSLRALAERLGLSAPFLSDIEHDRRRPSPSRLPYFEHVLGLDVGALEGLPSYELPPEIQAFNKAFPGVLDFITKQIVASASRHCSCSNCVVLG